MLPQVLPFSDKRNGYFGAANTFASIAGSLLIGLVTDLPFFHKRVQATTLTVMALATALFLLFALPLSFGLGSTSFDTLLIGNDLCFFFFWKKKNKTKKK